MTLAGDQFEDDSQLSANARCMIVLREAVFIEWERRVRMRVLEASPLSHPILINTFPALYDNIAEAITPDHPRTLGTAANTVASEHGGERARLTAYKPQNLVHEYQILRWTIFDVLAQNDVLLSKDEARIINETIDTAIRESVAAYALVQISLRQQFFAALAHDLRSPLSTVSLAAELLQQVVDPLKVVELAQRIKVQAQQMDLMIQDLLTSLVFQTGERPRLTLACFDVRDLAAEVCDQLTVYGSRFKLDAESVIGWWDRIALKRAMENLLGNAVKYGYLNTPITVRVTGRDERMIMSVHNEGDPIPLEQLENIFQVFKRATATNDKQIAGWGIGLPYVRVVAESHGGSINVDSSAECGTTFTIDIPADSRPFTDAPVLGTAGMPKTGS